MRSGSDEWKLIPCLQDSFGIVLSKSPFVLQQIMPPPPQKKDINPILFLRRCSFHDVVGTADRNSDVFLLLILVFTRSL
jgi:hypothetical protein